MYIHGLIQLGDGEVDWFYNRVSIKELEKLGNIIKFYEGEYVFPGYGS